MDRPPESGLAALVAELGPERCTYPGLVRSIAEVDPVLPALTCGGRRLTYGELAARIAAVAAHLGAIGLVADASTSAMGSVLTD